MPLFILTETSAGFGLFKATDKKLLDDDKLAERLSTVDKIVKEIKYKEFAKFDSAQTALEEISGLIEGKVTPKLASLLNEFKDEKKVTLAVAESKLGSSIVKLPDLNIKPISDASTNDLFRALRQHLPELIPGMLPENFQEMSLGLSHSLSRHKLKFSPDKVDTMIVHAVSLLDDLDKELNTYAMRVKEWYGWHFPELAKILPDNLSYARVIVTLGMRSNATDADLSEILPHEIETAVKAAADISMGTEITEEDLQNIKLLAEQVISYSTYRKELSDYLENRMKAISPNMTELLGALVGARMIAHTGSLMNMAKNAGSTIQIIGAEKALFRALKTKHATPKYGLIYHASLVGQASGNNKGKMARQLASKVALAVRTDALADFDDDATDEVRASLGIKARAKLENNLRHMEGKPLVSKGPNPNDIAISASKWDIKEARKYNPDADGVVGEEAAKKPLIQVVDEEMADVESKSDEEMDDASDSSDDEAAGKKAKKEAKKAKKESKSSKKEEKKSKKEKGSTPKKPDYEKLAQEVGLSLSKFMKRMEKGQIKVTEDGEVEVLSKKAEKSETPSKPAKSSKRKHDDEEEEESSPKPAKSSKRKHDVEPDTPKADEKHKKKKKKHHKDSE